jgi:hypothetical protein
MAMIERAMKHGGVIGAACAAEAVHRQAGADRKTALARGAKPSSDPAWNAASLVGSATRLLVLRTNLSTAGPEPGPANTGFHNVAGAVSASISTLRGPTRRSSSGAIDRRQLSAAISRSAALIVTWASFSASAKVAADTAGPEAGAVANVGGAPGVADGMAPLGAGCSPRHAVAAASMPSGAVIRNCLRVFMPIPHSRST